MYNSKQSILSRTVFALALLPLAQHGMAATAYEGEVPAELVELILGAGPGMEARVYSDLLDDFPFDTPPEGFTVLGSVDQRLSRSAYLRSPLPPDEAESRIAMLLEEQGWLRLPQPSEDSGQQGGFVAAGTQPLPVPVTLCHDELGNLSLTGSEGRDGPVLSIRQNVIQMLQPGASCEQQVQMRSRVQMTRTSLAAPGGAGIAQYMPRLELPEQANQSTALVGAVQLVGGFSSSSGGRTETGMTLLIDWTGEEVYAHFAEQLREQGWEEEGSWRSELSAGSHWLREVDADTSLSGLFTVLPEREGAYALNFQLRQR